MAQSGCILLKPGITTSSTRAADDRAGVNLGRTHRGGVPNEPGSGSGGDPSSRWLSENWRQFAWPCILDTADPTTVPEAYSYGMTGTAQANMRATFDSLSKQEQLAMTLELFRVLAMIFQDISRVVRQS